MGSSVSSNNSRKEEVQVGSCTVHRVGTNSILPLKTPAHAMIVSHSALHCAIHWAILDVALRPLRELEPMRVAGYATFNSTCTRRPSAVAIFTRASSENRDTRPRNKSFMRGWVTPQWVAASACFQFLALMIAAICRISSARAWRLAVCSGVSAIASHTLLKVLVSPRNRSRFMSSIYLIGYIYETTSVRHTHSSALARAFQKSASLDQRGCLDVVGQILVLCLAGVCAWRSFKCPLD